MSCVWVLFVLSLFLTLFLSVCFSHLFFFHLNFDLYLFLFHVNLIWALSHWHSANWGVWTPWPIINHSQVMSPTSSTITTTQRPLKSSSNTIQRHNALVLAWRRDQWRHHRQSALSSPLFTQEREEPADRRQAYHSFEESLLPTQSFSVCHSRSGRPFYEFGSRSSSVREKSK